MALYHYTPKAPKPSGFNKNTLFLIHLGQNIGILSIWQGKPRLGLSTMDSHLGEEVVCLVALTLLVSIHGKIVARLARAVLHFKHK